MRNLDDVFASFEQTWEPRIVARVNDDDVRVAKVDGDHTWHSHADTDECFLVLAGRFTIDLRDTDPVLLEPGDTYVVPTRRRTVMTRDPFDPDDVVEPDGSASTEQVEYGEATHSVLTPMGQIESYGELRPRARSPTDQDRRHDRSFLPASQSDRRRRTLISDGDHVASRVSYRSTPRSTTGKRQADQHQRSCR